MRFLLPATLGLSMLAAAATSAGAQGFSPYGVTGGFGGGFNSGPAVDCQGSIKGLMAQRENAGQALQAANKKKVDVKTACGLLRNYVAAETKLMKFLKTNQAQCGVPADFMQKLAHAHTQSSDMSTKVCKIAATGGGGPRPPSAGLSEALGVNTVGGNAGADKPSAVFDTLHGNVLTQ